MSKEREWVENNRMSVVIIIPIKKLYNKSAPPSITMLDRQRERERERERETERDLHLRLRLSTIVGGSLSVWLLHFPLLLLSSWDGSYFESNERGEKTLHCIGLKWDPRESQTNFCWTMAKTKPEMCTVLIKCWQMEEYKCVWEREKVRRLEREEEVSFGGRLAVFLAPNICLNNL